MALQQAASDDATACAHDTPDAVVVSYNCQQDLSRLLADSTFLRSFGRIVVVDNASSDDSVAVAREHGVEVIASDVNVGFAAAANVGANALDGTSFAVMNADIRLRCPDDIPDLTRHFNDPAVAVVAPALVLPDGRRQDSARLVPTLPQILHRRLTRQPKGALFPDMPTYVPWAVGAFLLVRASAFHEVSGFDERYFLYFEDVDLCVRLNARGYRVLVDPDVRVDHAHLASSRKSVLSSATRHHIRSAVKFYFRHPDYALGRPSRAVPAPSVASPRRAAVGQRA